jgi:quinoprotein dehydrogenase-associated probable ABC transporter substrate-binding protein
VCAAAFGTASAAERELRVCADPDNLPYSHENGSGFENRIAQLVADELGAKLAYAWLPQQRGFIRKGLGANACDVVIGVPSDFERVRTTRPYYRSGYVFVFRAEERSAYRSLDDARLRTAKVGVQLIGDDLAATPPAYVLATRGIVDNVRGYTPYGDRPQAQRMIEAVASGAIDVALVWGPQAAYFARRQPVTLAMTAVRAPAELATVPFEFSMSMGVRKSDAALQAELDAVITRRRADLQAIMIEYNVPLAETALASQPARASR